jgi:hypothetical protein
MSAIILIDTSVYLNVLDVSGFNQDRKTVLQDFSTFIQSNSHFLLPLATIWETGNHIAHLSSGSSRRTFAIKLVTDIGNALNGNSPYRPTHFPDREEFLGWLRDFPEYAKRNKSDDKPNEGTSLADLSIIKEWERTCSKNPMSRVCIWSLDQDLSGYDQNPG